MKIQVELDGTSHSDVYFAGGLPVTLETFFLINFFSAILIT